MSVSIIILSIGITSAISTSLIASFIHKMSWHKAGKKSKYKNVNLCLSNFYQFNNHFYSAFSIIRELMLNSLFISLLFKYLICEPNHLDLKRIIGSFVVTIVFRTICQLLVYSKFYDEELVK